MQGKTRRCIWGPCWRGGTGPARGSATDGAATIRDVLETVADRHKRRREERQGAQLDAQTMSRVLGFRLRLTWGTQLHGKAGKRQASARTR